MIRIADKLVIIVFGYLRMISNSKRGSIYKVLEGNLEESRLECYLVSVWAREHKQVSPSKSFQEYPTNINKIIFCTWDGIFGDMEDMKYHNSVMFTHAMEQFVDRRFGNI
jgi:16S rRNA G1207 methylase RsmC